MSRKRARRAAAAVWLVVASLSRAETGAGIRQQVLRGGCDEKKGPVSVEDLVKALRSSSVGSSPKENNQDAGAHRAVSSPNRDGERLLEARRLAGRAVEKERATISNDELTAALNSCQSAGELAHNLLSYHDTDLATQAGIEEAIKRANIQHNLNQALEYSPELYGSISMLYVQCEVNRCAVKALVDTGAEATIMSWACAARCGVVRLVDERFAGVARGVGSSKIAGRIHVLPLKLGEVFLSTSVLVLAPPPSEDPPALRGPSDAESVDPEEGVTAPATGAKPPALDFLLGLDSLRRFQCSLDLERNVLVLRVPAAAADTAQAEVASEARSASDLVALRERQETWASLEVPFVPPP